METVGLILVTDSRYKLTQKEGGIQEHLYSSHH